MPQPAFRKILLLNPPTGLYRRDDRCQCTVEDQTVQIVFPPMELALAAACAERSGALCRIEDYPATGRGWNEFIADLKEFAPDLMIVGSTTATLTGDLETCRLAKELLPDCVTAGKGETLVHSAIDVLCDHPELELILPNESEEAVDELAAGKPITEIAGLHFRPELLERFGLEVTPNCVAPGKKAQVSRIAAKRDERAAATAVAEPAAPAEPSRVYFTGRRVLREKLDELPFPARHLLRNEIYRSPETGNPLTVVHGNRGCPAKCIYCPAGVLTDFSVRQRSVESVIAELKECVSRYGIREFLFHGDTFTINKKWLLSLCDAIVAEKLDIHWGCNSRVDTMDDERAAALKRAGCWVVAFGVESGDAEMLVKMRKNATLEQARDAVACCKRAGLRVHTFLVIGLPWETPDTLQRTYDFVRELDPDFFDFNIATPLPGTELHEIAVRENLFEAGYDPSRVGYAHGSMKTLGGMTSADLGVWRREHLLKMYLRPRYVVRMLARAGGPGQTMNYIKAGTKRLGQLLRTKRETPAMQAAKSEG
jgi:anaerobic magnesium-protoporphyrin IX monomethyl ester cyclase